MQELMAHNIVHHVCDKHSEYKDAKLLYRFRKDDGTFPLDKNVKVFMRGQSLYESLISAEDSIMKVREESSIQYQRTFPGCELIDWLGQNGETSSRKEAVELCRTLLEHGIIQHVTLRHHFFDSNLLYHFRINFRRRRRLTELLGEILRPIQEGPDSPFCLRKLNPETDSTSFLSVQPNKEIKAPLSAVRRSSATSLSGGGPGGYFNSPPGLVECNPKSVLKRVITNEELLCPGAPYIKKTIAGVIIQNQEICVYRPSAVTVHSVSFEIVGDAVGWGIVVRGGKPCHIQAVDPGGPAAAAGIKLDYKTISHLIMTGPRTLVMEVMEAIE
ncbi:DEP domain-containing mTOR-interacting protein [Acipenser ruthenus]|uniref:DEP domain-containing mTOR-interacting protein n=1 Tax=Acipenser ruthenus TaxID=7906 RepID=A0A444UGP0_ACIRT|nr:DEP domain-containing mTOR-interacting protein [Acipenser ruthenus]